MHRVELKAGVLQGVRGAVPTVPNAPCGVESHKVWRVQMFSDGFLMHRVELKELPVRAYLRTSLNVPNAPCGVESWTAT